MRGAHKKKHAAFGEQHCGCQARFSVTRPCGDSDYVILRMLEREHNHATDTMFAHVSSELRDKAEKAWRKWGHALNFSVIAEKLSEGVLNEFCTKYGRQPAEVLAAWSTKSELPPRDYLITEKYVRDFCNRLDAVTTTVSKDERANVEEWRLQHADYVFHHVAGADNDEQDVRARAGLRHPFAAPFCGTQLHRDSRRCRSPAAACRPAAQARLLPRLHH